MERNVGVQRRNSARRERGAPVKKKAGVSPLLKFRLVACCVIFLLCSAFKFMFPAAFEQIGEKVCSVIEGDGEYVAVMENIGQELVQGGDIRQVFKNVTGIMVE